MTIDAPLEAVVPLGRHHEVSGFECGQTALNEYLRKHALANQQNRSGRTFVVTRNVTVVGYYTLAAGSVEPGTAPSRVTKGLGRYPVPIILLARLAVDQKEKGKGLGHALLKDALLRARQTSDLVGCRAVLVHAKDEVGQAFYRKYGFEPSPSHELHLFLLMKDIEAIVRRSSIP
jgi:GNAT superfamily N-acetyltransferase